MNDIQEILKNYIKESIRFCFHNDSLLDLVSVEIPRDTKIADYSTNIAMKSSKILHDNPVNIANIIVKDLKTRIKEAENIEVLGPGFINFKIKKNYLASIINEIIKLDDNYGRNNSGNNEKVLVEYVSANPTGDLHLGHARGAAWGDSVTRLYNFSGYDCLREYYINDAGNQIEMLGKSLLSRYYDCFNKKYPLPDEGYHGQDVIDIAKEIASKEGDKYLYLNENDALKYFKELGIEYELDKIKRDLNYFRVEFDSWIHEKMFYENDNKRIKDCLKSMNDLGLTYYNDGALWFKTTLYGDDKDRVLIKKDGSYTYLTPDIANHVYKLQRGYTKLVDLWGADHHGYVLRMNSALEALGYPKGTLEVDLEQMVRLVEDGVEVKMSKRTGNAITLRELCDDVGVDAARYIFVSHEVGSHLDFDLNIARLKNNENPVYYAQYAYARMASILKESKIELKEEYTLLTNEKELDLLKIIGDFTNVVIDASKTRGPNKICNYIQKLSTNFHSYYASCKINDENNIELSKERLALIKAISITLKNSFNLIGVEALEKM